MTVIATPKFVVVVCPPCPDPERPPGYLLCGASAKMRTARLKDARVFATRKEARRTANRIIDQFHNKAKAGEPYEWAEAVSLPVVWALLNGAAGHGAWRLPEATA